MKKIVSARINMIGTASALLFSIFVMMLLNGSLAWLADSKSVSGNNMSVTIVGLEGASADIESHGVVLIENVGGDTVYQYDLQEHVANLPLHDPQGISYSKYEMALVVHITVDAPGSTELSLRVSANGELTTSSDNWFSNATTYSYAEAVTDAGGSPVPGKVKKISDAGAFVTFADGSPNTPIYKNEITLVGNGGIKVPAGNEKHDIFVIIEYNEPFISYITNIINADINAKREISYLNDIEFLIG